AFLPEPDFKKAMDRTQLVRNTENTLTTLRALKADLQTTRDRGYAIDNEEGIVGIRCVACPVFGHGGEVMGAISLAGPSIRMTKKRSLELGPKLRDVASMLSQRLGYNIRKKAL